MDSSSLKKVQELITIEDFVVNRNRKNISFKNELDIITRDRLKLAFSEISNWKGYKPTPLKELSSVSTFCGLRKVFYKDESFRLGLGSFKALGGAYAVMKVADRHRHKGKSISDLVVATASAGNHGRSVAWGARNVGCKSKIYVHTGVSKDRVSAMADYGAEVIRIDGNYDQALAACIKDSEIHHWDLVSDTSWDGYKDIPLDIMSGYGVLMKEVLEQMGDERPSHIFLPAGCGGLAAGVISYLWNYTEICDTKLISIESEHSSCVMNSVRKNKPVFVNISNETAMVGLSCGEVSSEAWKVLSSTLSHCVSISDKAVAPLMTLFANGSLGGGKTEAGECATSGVASLLAILKDKKLIAQFGLTDNSVILLIGTEGATDLKAYGDLLEKGRSLV